MTKPPKNVLLTFLNQRGKTVSMNEDDRYLDSLAENEDVQGLLASISEAESVLFKMIEITKRRFELDRQVWRLPNGTVAMPYTFQLDPKALKIEDISIVGILGLEDLGLSFDPDTYIISGTPNQSGSFELTVQYFLHTLESNKGKPNEKMLPIIFNPDPKSLWKDLPSNQEGVFPKKDNEKFILALGEKTLVAASKRGRSHANVGSYRDDHVTAAHLGENGWSVVAVSDGAGSAKNSRKGSKIACNAIIEFFQADAQKEDGKLAKFETQLAAIEDPNALMSPQNSANIGNFILSPAVRHAHESLDKAAKADAASVPEIFSEKDAANPIRAYHATLIFAVFKKFDFGYVILTFSVGDCPIAIMSPDETDASLLNWLDVGEFGGGTRFITQASILQEQDAEHPLSTRFGLKIVEDFSYLFLMTDGIYDPKFEVEANLEKNEKWVEFLADLRGENEANTGVEFDLKNPDIALQLSNWMDFWSKGNHDDRTLAVIF